MKSKVLLVRPRNVYNYNNYPPLNLISLGSTLEAGGYDVKIVNSALEEDSLEIIDGELDDTLLVGISILTSELPDACRIMKHIKTNSDTAVVVGGWHCTLFPDQMAESEYVDYVVAGEGEEHLLTIADLIKSGRKHTEKVFSKQQIDLETLPSPNYRLDGKIDVFVSNFVTDKLAEYAKQPMRWLPYESSRGCPSHCTFCINVVTQNTRYRKKTAKKVLTEIEDIVNKFNLTHVKIIDDNFFVDIERVRLICEGLIESRLNITWDAECRCDYFNDRILNDRTLDLAVKSGLIQLTLGVESGSPHTLKLMKKGITPEQAEYAVQKCNDFGIIARSSFILEIPGERLKDIKETISFISRLRKHKYFTCGVGTFRPYPKCELTQQLLEDGYLVEPQKLSDWTDTEVISMYTSAEFIRPWQVNGKYSESAAYYLNMQSSVRLGSHQLSSMVDRLKNGIFISLAKLRNWLMFYSFPVDKYLYRKFVARFYKQREDSERSGSGYPLPRVEETECQS